jgi:hypothetical protein
MNITKIGCCLNSLALSVGLIACGNDISETNPSSLPLALSEVQKIRRVWLREVLTAVRQVPFNPRPALTA